MAAQALYAIAEVAVRIQVSWSVAELGFAQLDGFLYFPRSY